MASDCGDLSLIPTTAWRGCVKQIGNRLSETRWIIQASACRHSVADIESLACACPKMSINPQRLGKMGDFFYVIKHSKGLTAGMHLALEMT